MLLLEELLRFSLLSETATKLLEKPLKACFHKDDCTTYRNSLRLCLLVSSSLSLSPGCTLSLRFLVGVHVPIKICIVCLASNVKIVVCSELLNSVLQVEALWLDERCPWFWCQATLDGKCTVHDCTCVSFCLACVCPPDFSCSLPFTLELVSYIPEPRW